MLAQHNAAASDLLAAALRYAPRTIPLQAHGKAPAVGNDWPAWRATHEAIRDHWHRHPAANVGIRTGGGLVVVDVDPRATGTDVLADLEHEHGQLPATVECRPAAAVGTSTSAARVT